MTPAFQSVQEISALHEAAHCVIKWRLTCDCYQKDNSVGFDVIVVRTDAAIAAGPYIDSQGRQHNCTAISEMSAFQNAGMLDDDVRDFAANSTRRKMGHDIIVALAGPVAEAKVRNCSADSLFDRPHAGFQDYQQAAKLILFMNLKPEDCLQTFNELRRQTEDWIADRQVWNTICALSGALLARGDWRLTGEQALPVMTEAWNAATTSGSSAIPS